MKTHRLILPALLAFTLAALPLAALAQDKTEDTNTPAAEHKSGRQYDHAITDCRNQPTRTQTYDCTQAHLQTRTIFLTNTTQQSEANEILIAVRNLFDPGIRIYLVSPRNAITITSYPEEIDRIQAFIKNLDIPRPSYRLTYTLTESDAGKRIGTQHFSMIVVSGQRTTLKQGSKIPVITGSYSPGGADSKTGPGVQTQYTYLDVGENFDATLTGVANGAMLKTKVEQSSIADQKSAVNEAEPIVRQTVMDGYLFLPTGKPVILGSIDIVGSTRHIDIDVMMEPIP
ncbi:MAG TPA: secretin N-terminal domain-containing protein [Acidobacteriaceae bacterium]|nr:secretin N-terminal domain-containing protein [Acidobacteriaceae bacterium]